MKNLLLTIICCVFAYSAINAQCSYTSKQLAKNMRLLLEMADLDVRSTYTYGNLSRGDYTYVKKTFYQGTDYAIFAAGDDDCRDIDIAIYDKYWNLVASDSSADSAALAEFRARYTGTYNIKVKMYSTYGSSACYAVRYAYY